ncbi:MAG: hypothetical protein WHX93_09510 [bacterium]
MAGSWGTWIKIRVLFLGAFIVAGVSNGAAQSVDNPTIRVAEYGLLAETPFYMEERTNHLPFRLPDKTCNKDADCRWTLDETRLHLKIKATRGRKIVRVTKQVNREDAETIFESTEGVGALMQPVFLRPGGIRLPCRQPGEPMFPEEQEEYLTVEAFETGPDREEKVVERSTQVVIIYRYRCLKDPTMP